MLDSAQGLVPVRLHGEGLIDPQNEVLRSTLKALITYKNTQMVIPSYSSLHLFLFIHLFVYFSFIFTFMLLQLFPLFLLFLTST